MAPRDPNEGSAAYPTEDASVVETYRARVLELEHRLDDLTRLVSDLVWDVDSALRITYISERVFDILGFVPHELIGRSILELGSFEDGFGDSGETAFRRAFRNRRFIVNDKDGRSHNFRISGVPVFDLDSGEYLSARGTADDDTHRLMAERALRDGERRYRLLVERSPQAMLVVGETVILFANATAVRLFGADSVDEIIGRHPLEFIHPDDHDKVRDRRLSRQLSSESGVAFELRRIRLNGTEFHASNFTSTIEWEGRDALLVSVFDDTEVKSAQAALAESEERFRDFAQSAADRFWETNEEHRVVFIAAPADQRGAMVGRDYLTNRLRWDMPALDLDDEKWERLRKDMIANAPIRNFRYRLHDTKGQERHLRMNAIPIFHAGSGVFRGYRGTTIDETSEVLARQEAEGIQHLFFNVIENFSEGFALWVGEGRFVYCNSFFRRIFRHARDHLVAGALAHGFVDQIAPAATRDPQAGCWNQLVSASTPADGESGVLHEEFRDGRWYQMRCHRLENGSRVLVAADTTEVKRKDEALREREKLLRLTTESVPAFIGYHDRELRFRYANGFFRKIGLDPDAVIGRTIEESFGTQNAKEMEPYTSRALAGEVVRHQNELPTLDGGTISTESTLIPDFDQSGAVAGFFVMSLDVTERRRAEQERERSRAALEAAQRLGHVGSFERDFDNDALFWSREMYRIHGLDPDGPPVTPGQYEGFVHPNDRARVRRVIDKAVRNEYRNFSHEYRIIRTDGSERNLSAAGEITYDSNKRPVKLIGSAQDITTQKRVQEALERAKQEAEKASRAKTEFLSSMSHELRTPMNAVLGYAQLLLQNKKEPVSSRQRRQLNQILKSGQHLLSLINDILDLSRIEAGRIDLELKNVSLDKLIQECLGLVGSLADRNHVTIIDTTRGNPPPLVRCDDVRLKQALLNLVSNAIKFNKPNGQVTIDWSQPTDRRVRISIADTGSGIPPGREDELFEPFSRLDATQRGIEGTGIGLAISKQLVERMGGAIGYVSELGVGSRFWIDVPAAERDEGVGEAGDGDSASEPPFKLSETRQRCLLYVEDDASNLQLLEEVIGHIPNLTLLSALDAESGIEIARASHPDVIVMDINLPGMSGYDAVVRLKMHGETADIPVIALSAAAMSKDIQKGLDAGFFSYLTKPFMIDEMLATIDRALAKADDPALKALPNS